MRGGVQQIKRFFSTWHLDGENEEPLEEIHCRERKRLMLFGAKEEGGEENLLKLEIRWERLVDSFYFPSGDFCFEESQKSEF